jgi:hypothetical protein
MDKFSFLKTINNLQARSCDKRLSSDPNKEHTTIEIVAWNEEGKGCWVIAYFEKTNEGFELRFVGSRPFDEYVNYKDFWKLISLSNKILLPSQEAGNE